MPDERDFVAKIKSKQSKKEKAERYGKGQHKAGWLAANARHLGGAERAEEEMAKQKAMDKALTTEKRLQTEPFSDQPARKKAKGEVLTIDEMRRRRVYAEIRDHRLKGYAALTTTHGDLNLELYAGAAPRTCENFLGLCRRGYYDGVGFHRLVPGLMVQGGDPTGTGRGGESIHGKPFEDEIDTSLSHNTAGILSMANAGPNTNKSQFFLTFGACPHLDGKHTIFGKLAGGMKVLKAMEAVGSDAAHQPKQPITILRTTIHNDPFEAAAARLKEQRDCKPTAAADNPYLQHLAR
jgi:cyclophilin family peptidyl-prolyl cis-trans isomerase